jgi:hypothetical protein
MGIYVSLAERAASTPPPRPEIHSTAAANFRGRQPPASASAAPPARFPRCVVANIATARPSLVIYYTSNNFVIVLSKNKYCHDYKMDLLQFYYEFNLFVKKPLTGTSCVCHPAPSFLVIQGLACLQCPRIPHGRHWPGSGLTGIG